MTKKYLFITMIIAAMSFYQTTISADAIKNPSAWSGTVQLGYSGTGGNSEDNNFSSKFTALYKKDKWTNSYKIDTLFSNNKSTTTAEQYSGTAEFNYYFKPRVFTFVRNNSIYDKFNAYDITVSTTVGFGKRIFNGDKVTIDLQGGPGYRYDHIDATDKHENDFIGYLSSTLNWHLSKNSSFQEIINVTDGKDNTTTKSESDLSTDIIGNLGMQVSFNITHNSTIPIGSTKTKKIDYRTDVTLLFSF